MGVCRDALYDVHAVQDQQQRTGERDLAKATVVGTRQNWFRRVNSHADPPFLGGARSAGRSPASHDRPGRLFGAAGEIDREPSTGVALDSPVNTEYQEVGASAETPAGTPFCFNPSG
jgi:hypothetical protein